MIQESAVGAGLSIEQPQGTGQPRGSDASCFNIVALLHTGTEARNPHFSHNRAVTHRSGAKSEEGCSHASGRKNETPRRTPVTGLSQTPVETHAGYA